MYCAAISCPATKKMMFPSLPPPEQVVPIVGIFATSNGRTCDVHHFISGNALLLLLSRPARGCGVLLRLRKMCPDTLAAFFSPWWQRWMPARIRTPRTFSWCSWRLVGRCDSSDFWGVYTWSSKLLLPCIVSQELWIRTGKKGVRFWYFVLNLIIAFNAKLSIRQRLKCSNL